MILAIIVCVIFSMVLGGLWYSPVLFVKPWMASLGLTNVDAEKGKKEMPKLMVIQLIFTIVMVLALQWLVRMTGSFNLVAGAKLGFILWLGFLLPVALSQVLFEKRSTTWLAVHTGYALVQLVVMGAILGVWR